MPKINLRLTEEEHEALRKWAQESHRSIQREAIWRLFADRGVLDVVRKHVVDEVSARAQPQPADPHFKPDFK